MNLKQIETFRAIMITGTVSAAAKLLFVSQPAVSRLLSHTEQRLGYPLFERIKGRLYPTTEAKILFNEVQAVYGGVSRIERLAVQLGERKQGLLSIVSSPSLGHSLIPKAITQFARRHPNVHVRFRTLTYDALIRSLLDNEADIGVLFVPIRHPNLATVKVGSVPMVCIMPSDHPYAAQSHVGVTDLSGMEMVSYRSGTPFSQIISELMATSGCTPKVSIEVDSQHNVCDLVREGVGLGIVDELTVGRNADPSVVARPLVPSHSLDVHIASSRYEPLSLLGQAFSDLIRNHLAA